MATANGTIVGSKWSGVSGSSYANDATAYAGGVGSSPYYVTFIQFKTPAFIGVLESIKFSMYATKGSGATVNLRYAILSSDSNYSQYVNAGTSAVSDSNQIVSGTAKFTDVSSGTYNAVFTVSTSKLTPNTTYYLALWAVDTTGLSMLSTAYSGGTQNHYSVTVTYYDTYTLNISQGTGSTITVKRGNTVLANGATIAYGDVLNIIFGAKTGYNLGTHTVNGSSFDSGGTHTVTGAVVVVSTASLKTYNLSISQGKGTKVEVTRNGTALASGTKITHGDVLTVTFTAVTGCRLKEQTVNGSAFVSGDKHTVTGAVTIVAVATALAYPIGTGDGVEMYCAFIGNANGEPELYVAFIGTGDGVEMYPNG